jgi:hypothetical protein
MAMTATDIRDVARQYLYGTGLAQKPTLVQGDGITAVTGNIVIFDIADGTKVEAEDTLSVYGTTDVLAYSMYVLSMAGNSVSAVNGYEGPAIPNSTATADLIFEVSPLVNDALMFDKIDVIVNRFLWPQVFAIEDDTVTPNMASGQVDMDARDEEIQIAMQKVGSAYVPIAASLLKWAPTGDFPSGKMGSFDFLDGSTVYYSAKRRITLADSTQTDELVALIATGAAALALGSALVEAKLAASQSDRARLTLGSEDLWQDFVTQKQQYNEDLSRDTVIGFAIDRG